jgi:hypothetical protein
MSDCSEEWDFGDELPPDQVRSAIQGLAEDLGGDEDEGDDLMNLDLSDLFRVEEENKENIAPDDEPIIDLTSSPAIALRPRDPNVQYAESPEPPKKKAKPIYYSLRHHLKPGHVLPFINLEEETMHWGIIQKVIRKEVQLLMLLPDSDLTGSFRLDNRRFCIDREDHAFPDLSFEIHYEDHNSIYLPLEAQHWFRDYGSSMHSVNKGSARTLVEYNYYTIKPNRPLPPRTMNVLYNGGRGTFSS